jgi:CBS domain-containing protein
MLPLARTIVPDIVDRQRLIVLPEEATVATAVDTMREKHVGAILIANAGRLMGIFTERDVVFRVVAEGRDPHATRLADVMTRAPTTLKPGDTVRDALDLMEQGQFRHLPVVEADMLVGIVSVRDLYRSVVDQMSTDIILLAEGLLQS